jgi:hypothetical protein
MLSQLHFVFMTDGKLASPAGFALFLSRFSITLLVGVCYVDVEQITVSS